MEFIIGFIILVILWYYGRVIRNFADALNNVSKEKLDLLEATQAVNSIKEKTKLTSRLNKSLESDFLEYSEIMNLAQSKNKTKSTGKK